MAPGRQGTGGSNNNNVAGNRRVSITSSEDIPVAGADVSFEELVARELCKSVGHDTTVAKAPRGKVAKKTFLKKGARGWWMKQPGAKDKVIKHSLVSKREERDAGNTRINSTRQNAAKNPSRSQRHSSISSSETLSPVATPPKILQSVPTSSLTVSPIKQTQSIYLGNEDEEKVFQSRHEVALWKSGSFRSTTSTNTMGWKTLRHSYEANQEREADEMAEFEAIEQDLAAEREAYHKEKQQLSVALANSLHGSHVHDNQADHLRIPYSSFVSEFHEQELLREQSDEPAVVVDDSLNEEAEAALVFDDHSTLSKDDWVIKSDDRTNRLRSQLKYEISYEDLPSDISAVSFDDSVPWDEGLSFQSQQSPAHGQYLNTSIDTDPLKIQFKQRGDTRSAGNERRAITRGVSFADVCDDGSGSFGCNMSDIPPRPDGDAPVSSLVKQLFGGNVQDEGYNNDLTSDEDDMDSTDDLRDKNQVNIALTGPLPPPLPPIKDKSLLMLKQKLNGKQNTLNPKGLTGKTKGPSLTKLKPAARTSTKQKSGANTEKMTQLRSRASHADSSMVLPAVIEEKLLELEEEVKFYKSETLQLRKRKDYYDQEVKKLSRERDKIAQYQQEQRLLIEKEWEHERVKMKKEEKYQERQWKVRMNATKSHQDRKERSEVEMLKAQIVKMQLDEKARVSKLKAGNDILRQRITELEDKNRELCEDVKFLEKDRLEQWEKYECLVKERQDASKSVSKRETTTQLSECGDPRTIHDVSVIKGTADELLQRWSFPHGDGLHRGCESTPTAGQHHSRVQSNEVNVYNPKRYSLDRKNSHLSSGTELYIDGNGFDNTNDINLSRVMNPASSGSFAATTFEWTIPVAGDDQALQNTDSSACSDREVAVASTSTLSEQKMVSQEINYPGGKKELRFSDGSKKITFLDGNEKDIDANGNVVIKFTNGDLKEVFPDTGISVYYYFEAQTKLTTYPDNRKIYEFPNQQIETSLPDGTTEIQFADGIIKTIRPNGDELSVFPDGTTMLEHSDGLREVTLLNKKKIRYFPDGQMACISPGGLETRVRSDSELKQLLSM